MERYSRPPGGSEQDLAEAGRAPVSRRAGFVLAGGCSARMGRDKALLPYAAATLGAHIAAQVMAAAGSVTLIGDPERYSGLGRPVVADLRPGCGPLGGVETALSSTRARWNLVVACDMPRLTPAFLQELLDRAERSGAPCFAPLSPDGRPEPLCAVWRNDCLAAISDALDRKVRKMAEALEIVQAVHWRVDEASWSENWNTPEDWAGHCAASPGGASRE